MSIKNWFVRNEAINNKAQGCLAYAHYLQDPQHPNHINKTEINILHNSPIKTAVLAIEQAYAVDQSNHSKGKGGRSISSFMQSYVFSLPENINLSDEDWKRISKEIIIQLSKKINLDPKILMKYSSFVLHKQSNTHLNLIVCRCIEGKTYQQLLTRPSATNLLKRCFNASVLKCGYNFEEYKPKRKVNKKLSRWQELNEKEHFISLREIELEKINNRINIANNQLAKIKVSINENNDKDFKRQTNRINKTINNLSPIDQAENIQLEQLSKEIEKLEMSNNRVILSVENKRKLKRN